ncbi:MAG: TolC family protein, partial [Acidobacteriota bacterium]
NNHQVGRSQYRDQILVSLQQIEDAYWELVFARQDLEVKKESLRLADQLLKLNRIKVEVGTLPPIEITQAEAEVAAREQGVIVAENAVADAEDVLRRTLNMPKGTDAWLRPIKTMDEPTFYEWPIDLDKELREAFDHRPDLEQARLDILNADTQLAFDRNQLKWDLNFRAAYTARGLSGDSDGITRQLATAFDDAGIDGVPGTGDTGEGDGLFEPAQPPGPTTPGGPGENLTLTPFQLTGPSNQDIDDALRLVRDRDFESWSVSLSLNVPIGNRAAQSSFVGSRLEKAQADARLERAKLNAEVEVRTAARAILTDKKRIEAAEKNVELQRKKVEAEQKKFENGMSTSFQVLDFQEDLTTALGDKNRALVDYRKSISTLEKAKGTLDKYLHVKIQ